MQPIDTITRPLPPRRQVPRAFATMPSGARLPLLGFGTYQLQGAIGRAAVRTAVEAGLRHIDTATSYANEAIVGQGLRDAGIDRRELFVTSKLPPAGVGRERVTLEASLAALETDHLDLWLVHHPPADEHLIRTWERMLELQDEGLATDVGVSNFTLPQIDRITRATGRAPAVDQIRWNPFLFVPELAEGLSARGVVLSGYSPLRRADLRSPLLRAVASQIEATPAQTILIWHLLRGWSVLFRSSRPERIRQNADIAEFSLARDALDALDALRGTYVVP